MRGEHGAALAVPHLVEPLGDPGIVASPLIGTNHRGQRAVPPQDRTHQPVRIPGRALVLGVEQPPLGIHPVGGAVHQIGEQVNGMDCRADEQPATVVLIPYPGRAAGARRFVRVVVGSQLTVAEAGMGNQLLRLPHRGRNAELAVDDQLHAGLVHRLGHLDSLLTGLAERLFHEQMLTGPRPSHRQRVMGIMVRGNDDQINAVVAHDPAGVRGGIATTKLCPRPLGSRLDNVAEGHHLNAVLRGAPRMAAPHPAAADQCRFHHEIPPCGSGQPPAYRERRGRRLPTAS